MTQIRMNLVLRSLLKPYQDTALMNPEIKGMTKRKTIPINIAVSSSGAKVYPTFHVNDIVPKRTDCLSTYVEKIRTKNHFLN